MGLALEEAAKGLGRTSPNPPVGAILVKEGRVLAAGHHAAAGAPHAEIMALAQAGEAAQGADLYVTLEPCNHLGRTPPCAEAVVRAGVARVFIGTPDPNPIVSGRGIRHLEAAGIPVSVGLRRQECDRLIEGWSQFIRLGKPWIIAKVASTMDGRIATRTGDSQWITSEETRARVHRLRNEVDAVLVGRGTVEADDPRLTARHPGGRDPLRVILDSDLRVLPTAKVFSSASAARAVVACVGPADPARAAALREVGVEIIECPPREGRVDLEHLLNALAARGVVQILVEGGAEVFSAFLEEGLIDRLLLHYGPLIFGDGPTWATSPVAAKVSDALRLHLEEAQVVGSDLLVDARVQRG